MAQVVVEIGKDRVRVEGRAAVMIAWLAKHWEMVNTPEKGDVTFNYGREQVSPAFRGVESPEVVGR